jgi:hypothetical protein
MIKSRPLARSSVGTVIALAYARWALPSNPTAVDHIAKQLVNCSGTPVIKADY